VSVEDDQQEATRVGLCCQCRFMRQIRSDRRSIFYYCQRSETDEGFPKYPRLPVLLCRGYETNDATEKPVHDAKV